MIIAADYQDFMFSDIMGAFSSFPCRFDVLFVLHPQGSFVVRLMAPHIYILSGTALSASQTTVHLDCPHTV